MNYLTARLKERDTQTVIAAAVYSVVRSFLPPQYVLIADMLAGAFGLGIAATPLKS